MYDDTDNAEDDRWQVIAIPHMILWIRWANTYTGVF